MKKLFLVWTFALSFLVFTGGGQASAERPTLLFYPPAPELPDGRTVATLQTMNVPQITERVSLPADASGVVLIVYWSTLCPEANRCSSELIDGALSYWGQRGKQVVLDVVTVGFPVRTPTGIQGPAPSWLDVNTYTGPARILDTDQRAVQATMPDFRDPRFIAAEQRLVDWLRRYDGNKTIAQIRIATGAMGEDNPLIGPVMASSAGISEQDWLEYTRRIAAIYFATFHKTELEFDLGRLAWMAARGSPGDRQAVDLFIGNLLEHRVFLAYNGLNSETLGKLQNPEARDGLAQAIKYIRDYKARGGRIGLEAANHAAAPAMQDVQAIAEVVDILRPSRLVLFYDLPGRDAALHRLLSALSYR